MSASAVIDTYATTAFAPATISEVIPYGITSTAPGVSSTSPTASVEFNPVEINYPQVSFEQDLVNQVENLIDSKSSREDVLSAFREALEKAKIVSTFTSRQSEIVGNAVDSILRSGNSSDFTRALIVGFLVDRIMNEFKTFNTLVTCNADRKNELDKTVRYMILESLGVMFSFCSIESIDHVIKKSMFASIEGINVIV